MIGALMGREEKAEEVIADMQSAFDRIKAACSDEGKTVYFEVSPLQWGLWTAGSGTFMDELAGMCGLTNAFSDLEGWQSISEEQVIARDPDYIVTITKYYGEGPTPVEEILGRAGWNEMKVWSVGGETLMLASGSGDACAYYDNDLAAFCLYRPEASTEEILQYLSASVSFPSAEQDR